MSAAAGSVSERFLLGFDVGTSAVKSAAFTPTGETVAVAVRKVELSTPGDGICEVDPRAYWDALVAGCADLRRQGVDTRAAAALAVAANAETLLPVDERLEPVRPGIVWLDTRSRREALELAERFGVEQLARVSGQPQMIPMWPATKLLWLRRHEPRSVADTRWWLQPLDYLTARLTGEVLSDHSEYSSSLLLDIGTRVWWKPMLDEVGVEPGTLPKLVPASTPIGPASGEAQELLGIDSSTVVVMGGFDQACTAVGAGNVRPGVVSESTGTSLAVIATIVTPTHGAGGVPCHVHVVPDRYFLCAHNPAGGSLLDWFRTAYAPDLSFAELDALAATAEAGSDGLVLLPYLSGSATPSFDPAARGVLFGLTLRHERRHLVRALLEAVAFALADLLDVERGLGVEPQELRSVGGGATSRVWSQIKADVTGLKVRALSGGEQAGALGAAVLAGVGGGFYSSIEDGADALVHFAQAFEPDSGAFEAYADARRVYGELYPRLHDLFA
jgi:xylulokinase